MAENSRERDSGTTNYMMNVKKRNKKVPHKQKRKPPVEDADLHHKLDFSQAFSNTNLGTTLCFTNPMLEKFHQKHLRQLHKQQHNRYEVLCSNQKNFFVEQVLDKGLNSQLRSRQQESQQEPPPRTADQIRSRSRGGSGLTQSCPTRPMSEKPVISLTGLAEKFTRSLPIIRSETTMDSSNLKKHEEEENKHLKGRDKRGILRSRSMSDLHDKSRSHLKAGTVIDSRQQNLSKLPPIGQSTCTNDPIFKTQLPCINEANSDDAQCKPDTAPVQADVEKAEGIVKKRRTLEGMRRDPTLIFPKMDALLEKSKTEYQSITGPDIRNKIDDRTTQEIELMTTRKQSMVQPQETPRTEENVRSGVTTSEPLDYVKLVQNYSAYLPPHLRQTAQQQLCEMGKTGEIQEKQEELIKLNRAAVSRDRTITDPRWRHMEGSLCDAYGITSQWQKIGSNHWRVPRKHIIN